MAQPENLDATLVKPVNTEVRFASFLSGGFITVIVVNPPGMELAKRTSVRLPLCPCIEMIVHILFDPNVTVVLSNLQLLSVT